MFFISTKKLFRSWDTEIFVYLAFLLFHPVSYWFRGCLKINLKVYDVINCLSKNLITHFVWYLEKEKRYDIPFKNKIFLRWLSKKPLKSWHHFFSWTKSFLVDKVIKNKRGLELETSRSSGYKTSSEKFLFYLYIIWSSLMM